VTVRHSNGPTHAVLTTPWYTLLSVYQYSVHHECQCIFYKNVHNDFIGSKIIYPDRLVVQWTRNWKLVGPTTFIFSGKDLSIGEILGGTGRSKPPFFWSGRTDPYFISTPSQKFCLVPPLFRPKLRHWILGKLFNRWAVTKHCKLVPVKDGFPMAFTGKLESNSRSGIAVAIHQTLSGLHWFYRQQNHLPWQAGCAVITAKGYCPVFQTSDHPESVHVYVHVDHTSEPRMGQGCLFPFLSLISIHLPFIPCPFSCLLHCK